jgi:integrase
MAGAMTMVLTAYGIPWGKGQRWHYKPPSRIQMNKRRLPSPLEIYKLIHYKYSKDPYENALIQYSLMHAYQIGWRVPSEPCAMIVDNVDFDNGILTVIEPKKHRRERPLILDETLMYDHRRKSLKNWIDHWRPKVANHHSGNALYLRPDGRPITDEQFRSLLSKKVKPAHLQIRKELGLTNWDDKRYIYYPNQPRHWVGTGKIVEEYIRTKGHWNDDKVRRWLGHTKEGALKHYIVDAEQYIKLYPYDWFKRLLKFHVNDFDMGGVKPQKSINTKNTLVSNGIPPRERNAVRRTRTGDRSVNSRVLHQLS